MISLKRSLSPVVATAVSAGVIFLILSKFGMLESRKGERSLIIHEAKLLQIELGKSDSMTAKYNLEELIVKVSGLSDSPRWRISDSERFLIETVKLYNDFQNVNDSSRWRYCIDKDRRLILKGMDGREKLINSSFFDTE